MSSAIVVSDNEGLRSLGNLTRKRTFKGKRKFQKKQPLGLRRYLAVRGTPDGVYEVTRHVNAYVDVKNAGIQIGATFQEAATWVFYPGQIALINGINVSTWLVPQAAELSALWDKIKIDTVEMKVTSNVNGPAVTAYTTQPGLIFFAEDDNDSAATFSGIKQMECVSYMPGFNAQMLKMQVKPKYQRLVYYTAALSSYEPCRGYVVSGTDIPHYGIKMGTDTSVLAPGDHRLWFDFTIKFKLKELK